MNEFFSDNIVHFWWSVSAFVVFVLILLKLGVKQILAEVDAREEKIARELKESEAAYTKAKHVRSELEARMRGAEAEIAKLMGEARREAEEHKVRMTEQGRVEIEAARNRALRDIETARNTALVTLRREIAEISLLVAEKVVHQHLDGAKHEELVSSAISAYESSAGKAG